MAFVQIIDIDTGKILKRRKISNDAGSVLRRNMVDSMYDKYSISYEDTYVVEFDSENNILNKYQLM